MQHLEWVGSKYENKGLNGQRIALAGYSHYENGDDYPELTQEIVERIRLGTRYAFFTSIRNAFGATDPADFWDRVLFFNFIPRKIGTAEDKFGTANKGVNEEARDRVLRILREHKPDKLIAFTTKGWEQFPHYPKEAKPLESAEAILSSGTYIDLNDHHVAAFGLAHPQGASSKGMKDAVRAILNVPISRRF